MINRAVWLDRHAEAGEMFPWLSGTARNLLRTHCRKQKRQLRRKLLPRPPAGERAKRHDSRRAGPVPGGTTLAVNRNVHWSDETGRLWRGQLVEVTKPKASKEARTWYSASTWGQGRLQ